MPEPASTLMLVLILLGVCNLIGLGLLWLHMDRRADETRRQGERIGGIDGRVGRLEERINYLPTHRELAEIRTAIGAVCAEMSALRERSQVTCEMVRTIQDHLLQEDD